MSNHIVQTIGLGRDFGRTCALAGVDLSIDSGTILALLGPNGAGKTTLMRLMMGMIQPTHGQVWVLGEPAGHLSSAGAGAVAYVGDRCEPARWATPRMLASLQAGATSSFDLKLFQSYCQQRELPMNRRYGAMSKGQRRWVLTSLILASRPKLILLDEPADGLDPAARVMLYDLVRQHVNDHDATAIITTHVIGDIQRVTDEVAIIDHGRLVLRASLEDLRESVRQIQLPADDPLPDLSQVGALMGSKVSGDTRLIWMRLHEPAEDSLAAMLPVHAVIRTVGLESLYLAVAGNPSVAESQMEGRA